MHQRISRTSNTVIKSVVIASLLIAFFTGTHTDASAQKRTLISGSLQGLKGQKSYGLKFEYDSMFVGTVPEREYLTEKRRAWEEKEPGKGDAFVDQWFDDRKALYEPVFATAFEGYTKIHLNDANAKYTLIVKTQHTEGGWNVGVMGHPGQIDGEMWIVETMDESHVIAKIGFYDFVGKINSIGDFQMTTRIKDAYQIAGKGLGDFVKRKAR